MRAMIPSLTIQPLLENAIYHGIELLPDGGEVRVSGKRSGDNLEISMTNPLSADQGRKKSGNKMAVSNILQRFELAYEHRAKVDVLESENEYSVRLIFPCDEAGA
jgi:two-component system sensor histidine kinase AlgZ